MKVTNELLLEFLVVFFCVHFIGLITIGLWVLDIKRMLK